MRKKKILISGILGYVAREICELLKDDYQIEGFDTNFIPDKVEWLARNGIKYHQRDVFDCKDLLQEAEFLIHTSGNTLVPMSLKDSNPTVDAEITKNGTLATRYLLQHSPKNCKFLFLSTHCIWDSLTEEKTDIDESFPPCPLVAYSRSKTDSEADIKNSGLDYIILRLASVYGYNPNLRYKILPNLFSKMAALNQPIKVFGSGRNKKPLVSIHDVGLVIQHLLNLNVKNETFNITSCYKEVIEVAEICKKFAPNLIIEHTNDEIPNLGYTISNKKITDTGFHFNDDLEFEIQKMVKLWSV